MPRIDARDEGPRTGAADTHGVAGSVRGRADDTETVLDPVPGPEKGGAGVRTGGGADASPGHGEEPWGASWQPSQRQDAQDGDHRRRRGENKSNGGSS